MLVVFSPILGSERRRTLNREHENLEGRFHELVRTIEAWQKGEQPGSGKSDASVRSKLRCWSAPEHLREILAVKVTTENGEGQRRHLGQQVLLSSRHDWDRLSIVTPHRRLTRAEDLFRVSKCRAVVWWPMFHGTDSNIRVHLLYCFVALGLLAILQQVQLDRADCLVSAHRALGRLQGIDETLVIDTNGPADRAPTEPDDTPLELADVVRLLQLAARIGTTVLEQQYVTALPADNSTSPTHLTVNSR